MSAKRGEDKPTTRRAWGEEPPAEEASERTRKQKIKDFADDKTPEKLKNPTDIQVRFRTGFIYGIDRHRKYIRQRICFYRHSSRYFCIR